MFEKLLALLVHGKAAAAAGVLVVGTSGLLVTGTIGGQDVNLTLTPVSQEVTTEQTTTNTQSSPLVSETQPTNEDGTVGAEPEKGCSNDAHARNLAQATVKLAWDLARDELETLGAEAIADGAVKKDVAKVLRDAKKDLDGIRKDGQGAVHEAADLGNCKDDDDDEDGTDDDENGTDDDENGAGDDENGTDDDENGTGDEDETPAITLDVDTSMLDEQYLEPVETAIQEMEDRLNEVADELAEMVETDSTEQATQSSDKGKSKKGKSENKGKGHDRDNEDDEDDD